MLAFDIETTGLDPSSNVVTAACVYDKDAGIEKTYIPALGHDMEEFLKDLDNADRLCSFYGLGFDIPFIQHQYKVSNERVQGWVMKLYDICETSRICFGRAFQLQSLLLGNGLEGKNGSGSDAILLACNGDWEALGKYCMQVYAQNSLALC